MLKIQIPGVLVCKVLKKISDSSRPKSDNRSNLANDSKLDKKRMLSLHMLSGLNDNELQPRNCLVF